MRSVATHFVIETSLFMCAEHCNSMQ